MNLEKKFIIFLIVLFFCKQLNSITPTPIVSYNGTNPTSYAGNNVPLYTLSWDGITNRILVGGTGKYDQLIFSGTSLSIKGWQGGPNACITCNPKGTYGAAGFATEDFYKGHIKIYDFVNNAQALDYPGQGTYLQTTVNLLSWSPDGTKLAAIYDNNTLKIYSVSITPYSNGTYARATLTLLGSSSALSNTVTALSWNQLSTAIAVTSSSIYVYNTNGSLLSTISGSFTAASWNPYSSMNLYLEACSSSGTIYIYKFTSINTAPTTTTFTKDFGAATYGNPTKIAWNNDGTFVGVCSKTKPYVKTFKFSTTAGLSDFGSQVSLPGDGTDIAWNYDNKYLAVTADVYLNIYSFSSDTSTPVVTPPVASFTATPASGTAPLNVQFTGSGTNSPTSWSWDFGDGTTSTLKNPTHSYTARGTYTVKLTASNAGGSNSTTQTVTVTVTSEPTNALQEALTAIKTYNSTSLDAMITIINNINNYSFDNTLYKGSSKGDLIYAKLVDFYNNHKNINLELLAACYLGSSNGLLDLAVDKDFLNDIQKGRISSMIEIIKLEFNLKIALIALNTGTDKLKAIDAFLATSAATDAKNLRRIRESLKTQESLIV